MVSFKETLHPGAAIMSEANGQLSRENVTIPVGQKFPAGTLIVVATGIPLAPGGLGPIGYSIYGVDTTVAGAVAIKTACVVRDAELNRQAIAWGATFTDANKDAAAVETAKTFLIIRGAALPSPSLTMFEVEPASADPAAGDQHFTVAEHGAARAKPDAAPGGGQQHRK